MNAIPKEDEQKKAEKAHNINGIILGSISDCVLNVKGFFALFVLRSFRLDMKFNYLLSQKKERPKEAPAIDEVEEFFKRIIGRFFSSWLEFP
jgi:hypothetical protein